MTTYKEAKHIPGPWTIEEKTRQWTIYGPNEELTAVIYKNEYAPEGQMEATARLIGATPLLLEACKFALAKSLDKPSRRISLKGIAQIKAAIALAT